jgi:hypothetical protein
MLALHLNYIYYTIIYDSETLYFVSFYQTKDSFAVLQLLPSHSLVYAHCFLDITNVYLSLLPNLVPPQFSSKQLLQLIISSMYAVFYDDD